MTHPLLDYLSLHHPLPEADAERIAAIAEPRSYREGEVLSPQDHICRQLFFVVKGVARITMTQADGQTAILFFVRENKFCTILKSFLNQTAAQEGIEAACDMEVLVLQREALYTLYKELPYLQTLINQITQQTLLDKITLQSGSSGLDAAGRYRYFLQHMPDVATRVSLTDIAAYLGITPQSLSRIRKQFKAP
ncbi:Crp/Fnr family transcriptional regulator [Chitinophaga parva]|uniref:Crp/Fnr family transcriptional regulator n=1 Tax=Chitinophaga parva TaxID=2169414 RepID=A0A2T7BIS5_9BACT|nr:Crp/Fnr family transcriptional regulator [Chitinophaga parva]PUZ26187.1 Crp/Fnr family transcriptional regulator [Chitinophaga parva]